MKDVRENEVATAIARDYRCTKIFIDEEGQIHLVYPTGDIFTAIDAIGLSRLKAEAAMIVCESLGIDDKHPIVRLDVGDNR